MQDRDTAGDQISHSAPIAPGLLIDHYRIVAPIGSGGMGEVFLAEDTRLGRQVALKFLPTNLCADRACRERFAREAQAAAKLDHPNIATVYGVGEHEGRPYFAMQYVDQGSLRMLIDAGPLEVARALELAGMICEGLAEAHAAGVVHRDIKPGNVLIDTKGRAKLVDFGLARVRGSEDLTQTGATLGTLGYMAPEQVLGEPADHRCDIFSTGVVLYEMLTGCSPFMADSAGATVQRILNSQPEPLSQVRPEVSPGLQRILDGALAKDPAQRPASIAQLHQELRDLSLRQEPSPAVSAGAPSIAVLPFANLSTDSEQEYFCDGMAEEIITALTRVEGLRVVARTSSFAFKGKQEDMREIGRKLNVERLLEGSVRKAGNRLRVTAQLINVADGYHLWSERYDRELADVFAVQDEITLAIVEELKGTLRREDRVPATKRYSDNLEAHSLYLRGRQHWNLRSAPALRQAISYFEQAVALDADYAPAYVGLADSHVMLHQAQETPAHDAYGRAKVYLDRALAIDKDLGEAHATLGLIRERYDWDRDAADVAFASAIELSPGYASAYQWRGMLWARRGRHAEGIRLVEKARELDPLSPILPVALAVAYVYGNQLETAEQLCLESLRADPETGYGYSILSFVRLRQRRWDEAAHLHLQSRCDLAPLEPPELDSLRAVLESRGYRAYWARFRDILLAKRRQRHVSPMTIAGACTLAGDTDGALQWLETTIAERDGDIREFGGDWGFGDVVRHPRYGELLKLAGFEA
jgi:TolB-like protein/Flp pilus assembly protein TadD